MKGFRFLGLKRPDRSGMNSIETIREEEKYWSNLVRTARKRVVVVTDLTARYLSYWLGMDNKAGITRLKSSSDFRIASNNSFKFPIPATNDKQPRFKDCRD